MTPPMNVSVLSASAQRRALGIRASSGAFGRVPVCNRGDIGQCSDGLLSNGTTDLSLSSVKKYTVNVNCVECQVLIWNGAVTLGQTNENAGPDQITVKASILDSSGVYWPLTFAGRISVVIDPEDYVFSDPIGREFAAGDTFRTVVYVSVTSGKKWVGNQSTYGAAGGAGNFGEGTLINVDLTADISSMTDTARRGFSPAAIYGRPTTSTIPATVAAIGESILLGYNSYLVLGDGPILRAFGGTPDKFGSPQPCLNLSIYGERLQNIIQPTLRRRRFLMLQGADYAVTSFTFNDLAAGRTEAQVKADLLTWWAQLAAIGLKVYQTTIGPYTSSTDGWTTVGNQTPIVFGASNLGQTARVNINNWLRAGGLANLGGVIEFADAVESARDSGKWKTGPITGDGAHPNSAGCDLLKATVPTTIFI